MKELDQQEGRLINISSLDMDLRCYRCFNIVYMKHFFLHVLMLLPFYRFSGTLFIIMITFCNYIHNFFSTEYKETIREAYTVKIYNEQSFLQYNAVKAFMPFYSRDMCTFSQVRVYPCSSKKSNVRIVYT